MKIVLVFAAVLVVALAEQCKNNMDCTTHAITTCSSGFNVVCHNGQCQCAHAGTSCTAQSDCSCDHGVAHCVDGMCHCGKH